MNREEEEKEIEAVFCRAALDEIKKMQAPIKDASIPGIVATSWEMFITLLSLSMAFLPPKAWQEGLDISSKELYSLPTFLMNTIGEDASEEMKTVVNELINPHTRIEELEKENDTLRHTIDMLLDKDNQEDHGCFVVEV